MWLGSIPARADGTVYRVAGCTEYIFVNTQSGYSVLRGSTSGIKDGDVLTGNVERIGQAVLFDQTAGRSVFAQISELRLSLPEITQRTATRCRSPLGAALISGFVSRANNCGNNIFVNTPQGYAMLERITGGIVADGDRLTGDFNKPGRATVKDEQSNATLVVFVNDLWLSKSAAERKMTAACTGARR
jgi:hypothetical protein